MKKKFLNKKIYNLQPTTSQRTMKKTILGFTILFAAINFGFAQEKKVTFTDRLVYQTISTEKTSSEGEAKYDILINNKNESLLYQDNFYAPMLYFQDNWGLSNVRFNFDNHLKVNYHTVYSDYYDDEIGYPDYNFKIEKLTTQETILGKKCQNYLLDYSYKVAESTENSYSHKMKVCIDEKNSFNNTNLLGNGLGILGIYHFTKDKINLKGLIMKIGQEESYNEDYIILKSQEKADKTVFIDHKKQRDAIFAKRDSVTLAYKELYKNYDSVYADSAYADSALDAAAEIDYIPEYTSTYKKETDGLGNLAIHNLPSKNYEKALPKYCFRIKEELPEFGNKEVGKHLQNYAGQLCDMYLSAADRSNVDKKGTTDEIRREGLWLLKNREKLDKKDQNLLDKYLDNLD